MAITSWAIDVKEVDGIYYELFPSSGNALVVKHENEKYTGDIYLPDEITVDSVTYSVVLIEEETFMDCTELTSIRLSENIWEISRRAFYGCTGLTSLVLPNSVTRIEYEAFNNCTGLTRVTLGNNLNMVEVFSFWGCDNVKEVIYAEGTKTILPLIFPSATSVVIPESVEILSEFAFQWYESLPSITIPNGVKTIMRGAFDGCI